MKFFKAIRKLKKSFSAYEPVVEIFISRKNLIHNLNVYQRNYPKLSLAPVLKSNAYGHGLVQIAEILDQEKIAFLVVDSLFEARTLKNEGIKSPLLVIGYTKVENILSHPATNLAFTLTSLDQLEEVRRKLKTEKSFHLKLDTGMHRQGLLPREIFPAIRIIQQNRNFKLEGVCSHLADADGQDEKFTHLQIKEWEKTVAIFQKNFTGLKFYHLAATAGTRHAKKFSSNVVRLGLGLYGINSLPSRELDLRPVLEMRSQISSVKEIKAGEFVGYNCTYKAKEKILGATVPVGYFEGVDRRLSNHGYFKMGAQFCPIIGRVSMNITSLDVSAIPKVKRGDPVSIISQHNQDLNSVENIAKIAHTIPYEILVHIPGHLKRTVVS